MNRTPAVRSLVCRHCGGQLRATADRDLYRCAYCNTLHLDDPAEVQAFIPAERLGRVQLARALGQELRSRGIRGHAIVRIERIWLPFWEVEATLAGWQSYESASTGIHASESLSEEPTAVEEILTRKVRVSLPACDLRGWGLLGIADVVDRVEHRPMRAILFDREKVLSVSVSRRASDRRILQRQGVAVRPPGARKLRQHFRLLRPDRSLFYYPVWKTVFTVNGLPCEAVVDGVRGRLLRAMLPHREGPQLWSWWGSTAVSARIAGLSPGFGVLGLMAWLLHRAGSAPVGRSPRHWAKWSSNELRGSRGTLRLVLEGEES